MLRIFALLITALTLSGCGAAAVVTLPVKAATTAAGVAVTTVDTATDVVDD